MADIFTEITENESLSYKDRIKSSCCGFCFAPFLLIGCIILLVWNEGDSIRMHKALKEGREVVVELKDNGIQQIQSNLDGSLIHFTGTAETSNEIYDSIFGVGYQADPNLLMIRRNTEMYQWVETTSTKKQGDTTKTTYSYSTQWQSSVQSSSSFKRPDGHQNPSTMLYSEQELIASPIVVGAHVLSSEIVSKIQWYKPYYNVSVNQILDTTAKSSATLQGDELYFGKGTPNSPQVGDTRVSFDTVESQVISVIAKQSGTGLSEFTGGSGSSFLLVQKGTMDAIAMFQRAHDSQKIRSWLIRLGGALLMFLSFYLLLSPFSAVADPIPIVGDLVEFGVCVISGILGFVCASLVIVCAWLAYRPILASCLFVGLIAIVAGVVILSKKKRKERQARAIENDNGDDDNVKKGKDEDDDDAIEEIDCAKMEEPWLHDSQLQTSSQQLYVHKTILVTPSACNITKPIFCRKRLKPWLSSIYIPLTHSL